VGSIIAEAWLGGRIKGRWRFQRRNGDPRRRGAADAVGDRAWGAADPSRRFAAESLRELSSRLHVPARFFTAHPTSRPAHRFGSPSWRRDCGPARHIEAGGPTTESATARHRWPRLEGKELDRPDLQNRHEISRRARPEGARRRRQQPPSTTSTSWRRGPDPRRVARRRSPGAARPTRPRAAAGSAAVRSRARQSLVGADATATPTVRPRIEQPARCLAPPARARLPAGQRHPS